MADDGKMLDTNEAAAFLQIKPETVRVWARTGKISFYKIGGRYRFQREELLETIQKGHHKA